MFGPRSCLPGRMAFPLQHAMYTHTHTRTHMLTHTYSPQLTGTCHPTPIALPPPISLSLPSSYLSFSSLLLSLFLYLSLPLALSHTHSLLPPLTENILPFITRRNDKKRKRENTCNQQHRTQGFPRCDSTTAAAQSVRPQKGTVTSVVSLVCCSLCHLRLPAELT